ARALARGSGSRPRLPARTQGEGALAGPPAEVRNDVRVQEIYTGAGTHAVTGQAACEPNGKPLLTVARVNTFYGKSHVINDATLDVRDGEIVALLGRNGAGKSTLLKTLCGLTPAASGTIELNG